MFQELNGVVLEGVIIPSEEVANGWKIHVSSLDPLFCYGK